MSGQALAEYTLGRLLGRGGMAEVYEGHDPDLDRTVAIKVLQPAMSGEPGFDARFRREARLVAGLRHAHIVQIYDFGIADGKPFMVMEYLPGGALKDRLASLRKQGRPMPLDEAARILDGLAAALDYAHGRGAIHRDVKPANILFTAENEPVLVDFGIARLLTDAGQLTAAGQIVGTPAYMAPEQARGGELDGRCDQYALAVVLYEMTTGRTPFQGDTPTALLMQHLNTPPPPPRAFNPALPEAVGTVLLKALAKDPADRFPTVSALAAAFREALAGQSEAAVSPEAVTRPDAAQPTDASSAQPSSLEPTPAGGPPSSGPGSKQPSTGDRGARWLSYLLKVAGVFAPLVGSRAAPAHPATGDLRERLAAAMGAIGILFAALQLMVNTFNLISRPAALLGRALPYLAALLLIAGAVLAGRIALRATSQQRRRQASAFLAFLLLATASWGGYTAYNRLRPPQTFLILIADFDGTNATRKGDFARQIGAALTDQLSAAGNVATVQRTLEVYTDAEAARTAGRQRKAGMVIWGSYSDFGVTPQVELLREPRNQEGLSLSRLAVNVVGVAGAAPASPSRLGDLSHLTRAPITNTDLDLFAAHGPDQMTYVVSAILATGLYADGKYDDALALFDKALVAAAAAGGSIRGVERVYFQRAAALHALGRIAEATADLERAVQLDPAFAQAHYNLAISYAGGCAGPDGPAKAIAAAEAAVRLQPQNARAHRLLGSLYQQAGRNQEALASLQQALSHDKEDPLTYQLLAAVYTALGQTSAANQASAQAAALLEAALAGNPPDAYTQRLALGDARVAAGQFDQAIAAYQAAASLKPDAAAPHRGLGNAHYWAGRLDQALAEYRQAAALAPNDPAAYLLAGLVLAAQGDLSGAIASQQTAARLSQCDPAPHLLLGGLHSRQGDYAAAAAAYEAALSLDATDADVWYVLGSLRYMLKDPEAATRAAQKAVALKPNLIEAQRLLTVVRLDVGDARGALPAAQALVQLKPQEADNQLLLGDAYFGLKLWQDAARAYEAAGVLKAEAGTFVLAGQARQAAGQLDAASAHFRAALSLEPDNALAWQGLASVHQQQGRLADAAAAYEKALALRDDALARGQLGAIYLQQGNVDAAVAQYEAASRLAPQEPRYQVRLGGLYASRGQLPQAEAAFRAALALTPNDAEALAGLADAAYRQCRIGTAVQSMAAAANLAPSYRGRLAGLYEAQGRAADAETIYQELDALPPEDWLAHFTVADHHLRGGRWDQAMRGYQQMLEVGAAPTGYVTSLIYTALGQIDYAQERLFAAAGEFEQALAAYSFNADARAGLGDLALRAGDAAGAMAFYDAALPQIAQYLAGLPAENAALLTVSLHMRRAIALDALGDKGAANAARDQALAAARAALTLTPRSPVAQFALAAAHLARGETEQANTAFARASECDQTLIRARSRMEAALVRLQRAP